MNLLIGPLATLIPNMPDSTLYAMIFAGVAYWVYHSMFKHDATADGLFDAINAARQKKADATALTDLAETLVDDPTHGPVFHAALLRKQAKQQAATKGTTAEVPKI